MSYLEYTAKSLGALGILGLRYQLLMVIVGSFIRRWERAYKGRPATPKLYLRETLER
ncbi:hypothetical protein N431DRAFT_438839 [Stipitochalara longipes BDJ]|nr:hypothetical protein N431DRAFT_438839 [Stipitochalara longipes BDJ]